MAVAMNERSALAGRHSLYLLITASLSVAFLLASIYGFALANAMPRPLEVAVEVLLTPFVIPALFSPLFAGPGWFFTLWGLALALVVLGRVEIGD